VEGQQKHRDGQVWRMKCHEEGIGEEKTPACSPLMRLALSQRKDIIKKTDLCQFCYEQKKGSVCLSVVSERVISARNLATLTDTLQQLTRTPIRCITWDLGGW
jgi:hypothetical protein